jgi:hypothetical protein
MLEVDCVVGADDAGGVHACVGPRRALVRTTVLHH